MKLTVNLILFFALEMVFKMNLDFFSILMTSLKNIMNLTVTFILFFALEIIFKIK